MVPRKYANEYATLGRDWTKEGAMINPFKSRTQSLEAVREIALWIGAITILVVFTQVIHPIWSLPVIIAIVIVWFVRSKKVERR